MKQNSGKKWFINCIVILGILLGLIWLMVYIFDPYFHFHKPYSFVSYRLHDERYCNDGITRHFDYDALITGTSMSQNFKVSEIDNLYSVNAIKQPFSGAGYKELSENLDRALQRNEKLRTVFWGIDYNAMIRDADWAAYEEYPTYMYDDNVWNDIAYVFNKDVLYHGVLPNIRMTLLGQESTSMDEYSAWDKDTGLEYILNNYDRDNVADYIPSELGAQEEELVRENITQNIVQLVNKYPNTTFYLFYTPYSICYWDSLSQEGSMLRQLEAELITTELLLECPNVRLYNFFEKHEVICNTDLYRDKEHYSAEVNSMILEWMLNDEYLVTKDNYKAKLQAEYGFYMNYDYDSIYE
ncbi:MAG: hypothetical protein E7290_01150 [Lachnospiraceae bacterium]|nr:hypothetical protein [Lachnospiraceae bacterium]